MTTSTSLIPAAKRAIDSFLESRISFGVFCTVSSDPRRGRSISRNITAPPSPLHDQPASTLYILDSSYNPPSNAHLSLASSALHASSKRSFNAGPSGESDASDNTPASRLLLLFSVHNADKNPGPAPFEHRLAMMVLLAEDILRRVQDTDSATNVEQEHSDHSEQNADARIDVGLTTQPFYAGKSQAVEERGTYGNARHVHIVGTDTFRRVLDTKYYTAHDPPLSALNSFFAQHGLRVVARDDDGRDVCERLSNGEMEVVGGKSEWTNRIELVDAEDEAVGVSSTGVRKAVNKGEWDVVRACCSEAVMEAIREWRLYG